MNASQETFQLSWLTSLSGSKKFTLEDIKSYSGEGLIKIIFMVDSDEQKELDQVLSKYNRYAETVSIDKFAIIDNKARIQLKTKEKVITESLGMGAFYKTLKEQGQLSRLFSRGVKYLYFQPLNNLLGKILDFDLLDILISSNSDIEEKLILYESLAKSSFKKNYMVNSVFNFQSRKTSAFKKSTIFEDIDDGDRFQPAPTSPFDFKKKKFDLFPKFNQKNKLSLDNKQKNMIHRNSSQLMPLSIDNSFDELLELKTINSFKEMREKKYASKKENKDFFVDCISKVYDLGGEFALKIHDHPNAKLNSIKFVNTESGTNWSKLHSGEVIFRLEAILDREFLKDYNYGNIIYTF